MYPDVASPAEQASQRGYLPATHWFRYLLKHPLDETPHTAAATRVSM